jgi:hypothetical protein
MNNRLMDMDMHRQLVKYIHMVDMYIHIFNFLTQVSNMYIYIYTNYTY